MKESLRSFVAAILLALSNGSGVARTHSGTLAPDQQLVVRLYNLANVSARSLDNATQHAAGILATAGVRAVWLNGRADAPEAHTVDLARPTARKSRESVVRKYLVLVVVRDVPPCYGPGALGLAFPDAQTGVNAVVFYDRIERVRNSDEIDTSAVLGFAIAHEIGHVLLHRVGHSQVGIMKSPWSKADLRHAAARLGEFTALERKAICQQFAQANKATLRTEDK